MNGEYVFITLLDIVAWKFPPILAGYSSKMAAF